MGAKATHAHLEKLVRTTQLRTVEPRLEEFENLVNLARAYLADAARTDLSYRGRFDLAYGAAHALSLAALRRLGYRTRSGHVVFQCLAHTLSIETKDWHVLALADERHDVAEYSGTLEEDEDLLTNILRITQLVLERLLQQEPPQYSAL